MAVVLPAWLLSGGLVYLYIYRVTEAIRSYTTFEAEHRALVTNAALPFASSQCTPFDPASAFRCGASTEQERSYRILLLTPQDMSRGESVYVRSRGVHLEGRRDSSRDGSWNRKLFWL